MAKVFPRLIGLALALAQQSLCCPHLTPGLERWEDSRTWPNGTVPEEDQVIGITKPILLSSVTARLGGVIIRDGGRLVFNPESELVKLSTHYVLIEDNGSLEAGSEDCKFQGNAEIQLLGKSTDRYSHDHFGQKFIGVGPGGALELHGKVKKSWTRLTETLEPKKKTFNGDDHQPRVYSGFALYEFSADGQLVQKKLVLNTIKALGKAMASVGEGEVIVLTKLTGFSRKAFKKELSDMQDIIEGSLGLQEGSVNFTRLEARGDIWTMMMRLGDPASLKQSFGKRSEANNDGLATDFLRMEHNDFTFETRTLGRSRDEKAGRNSVHLNVQSKDHRVHNLVLQDNVSSWERGDQVVIASTDFDWEQAEVFTVLQARGKKVTLEGDLINVHYGDSYKGVDMFAEVGLLTRNIKVYGEMEEECYDEEVNNCVEFDHDSYGGHTQAVKGFKNYNIEGVEFFHMGQSSIIGRYPIHFHLALDTRREKRASYARNNAIHHSFSRCVTLHGSHYVKVQDNVAFDHYGHCFFLEDGGEKHNILDGNLGMGTRRGILRPSDTSPTTFWITSPLTTLVNNVAAGSQKWSGMGIWYLFPVKPVGESKSLGLFETNEAKHTPITLFKDNVAHSNGNKGLAIFRRLGKNHEVLGCSTYSPMTDPKNRKSDYKPVILDGFIGYKNSRANAIVRAAASEIVNFRLSDSSRGISLFRNVLSGYQRVRDAVIVGESPNKGKGEKFHYRDENTGEKMSVISDRSLPNTKRSSSSILAGVEINAEGPSHLENVSFHNFRHSDARVAAAILWEDKYDFHNGVTTSSKGLSFSWKDQTEGFFMHVAGEKKGDGDTSIMMRDLDGTLTGEAGSTVVPSGIYYAKEIQCKPVPGWNMDVCPERFAKLFVFPKMGTSDSSTFITDENMENRVDVEDPDNFQVSYTARLNSTFVVHWKVPMPKTLKLRITGLDAGDSMVVGLCLPRGTSEAVGSKRLSSMFRSHYGKNKRTIQAGDSLRDLKAGSANFYLDQKRDVAYFRFSESRLRSDFSDFGGLLTECVGGLSFGGTCQSLIVGMGKLAEEHSLDLNDGNCLDRM